MSPPPAKTTDEPLIILVHGQRALTIDLAAAMHGMSHDQMRKTLDRAGAKPIDGVRIGRQPLYTPGVVEAVLASRLRRGAPGVSRPHRPRREP